MTGNSYRALRFGVYFPFRKSMSLVLFQLTSLAEGVLAAELDALRPDAGMFVRLTCGAPVIAFVG
jgi:hypothetical protein